MKLLFTIMIILYFTGCNNNKANMQLPPPSPKIQDASKVPPSVPVIK